MTDYRGNILLDTYVRPTYVIFVPEPAHLLISPLSYSRHLVEDYRTTETGIQYAHLANGMSSKTWISPS